MGRTSGASDLAQYRDSHGITHTSEGKRPDGYRSGADDLAEYRKNNPSASKLATDDLQSRLNAANQKDSTVQDSTKSSLNERREEASDKGASSDGAGALAAAAVNAEPVKAKDETKTDTGYGINAKVDPNKDSYLFQGATALADIANERNTRTMSFEEMAAQANAMNNGEVAPQAETKTEAPTQTINLTGSDQVVNFEQMERNKEAGERVGKVIGGSLQNAWAGVTNTVGTMAKAGANQQGFRDEELAAAAKAMGVSDDDVQKVLEANFASKVGANSELGQSINENVDKFADKTFDYSDKVAEKGQTKLAEAKEGVGTVGQVAIDLGSQAVNMAVDGVINLVIPGSGLVSMGARVFGDSAAEQRAKGADIEDQLIAGTKSAAIEILSEKIAGPFEKIYGKTALGKVTTKAIDKITESATGRMLLKNASNFLGEGFEEIASDVLNTIFDHILGLSDSGNTLGADLWSDEAKQQYIYDGLIGGLMGFLGGAVENINWNALNPEQKLAAVHQATDQALREADKGIAAQQTETAPTQQTAADAIAETAAPTEAAVETKAEPAKVTPTEADITAVEEFLTGGTFTEQQARNTIVKNDAMRAAFEQVTGISLNDPVTGEKLSNNKASKLIVENFGKDTATTLAEQAQNTAETADLTEATKTAQNEEIAQTQENIKPTEQNSTQQASEELNSEQNAENAVATQNEAEQPANEANTAEETVPQTEANADTKISPAETDMTVSGGEIAEATPQIETDNVTADTEGAKPSQTSTNTERKVAEKLGGEQETLYYIPKSEVESLTAAVARVTENGFSEMDNLVQKNMWTGEDIDTAMTLYGKLKADDVRNGTHNADSWAKVVQEHGTRSGQALQAFAKWTRTGAGNASRIDAQLSEATNLSPEERTKISNDIFDFAAEFDSASESRSIDDIRSLIVKMAKYRNTWTFGKHTYEKVLNSINDTDYLFEYAFRQMSAIADDATTTADIGKKLKTWQVNAQLFRLSTFNRNILGNISFGAIDTFTNNGFGVALDHLVSKATGHRSVAFDKGWFSSEARKGAKDAFNRSVLEVAGDVSMSSDGGKYGTNSSRTFKMSDGRFSQFMSRWEQMLGYMLTTSDRTSRGQIESAVSEGLINAGVDADTASILAGERADYDLFQNKGRTATAAKGAHDAANNFIGVGKNGSRFGLGDVLMPYTGVPSNLAVKPIEYSPANIVKGTVELAQVLKSVNNGGYDAVKQQQAVMDIARGMAGVPIIAALTAAFKAGLIKNADDDSDDYDVTNQKAAEGQTGVQINLDAIMRAADGGSSEWQSGDDLMSISFLEPLNAFMAIASMIADESEDATAGIYAKDYFEGAVQAALDMPVMEAISSISQTIQYEEGIPEKLKAAGLSMASSAVTGMIPAPISQTARTTDKYIRDTSSDSDAQKIVNSLISNIPFARETLPVKTDNYGNARTYSDSATQRFLNNFVLPGTINDFNQSEISAEAERLHNALGDDYSDVYPARKAPNQVKSDGETYKLTTEEKREFKADSTQIIGFLTQDLLESEAYSALPDETKAEILSDVNDFGVKVATHDYIGSKEGYYTQSKEIEDVLDMENPADYFIQNVMQTTAKSDLKDAMRKGDDEAIGTAVSEMEGAGFTTKEVDSYVKTQVKDLYDRTGNLAIDDDRAISLLEKNSSLTEEEATTTVHYWNFKNTNPDSSMTQDTYSKYSDMGVSDEHMESVYTSYSNATKDSQSYLNKANGILSSDASDSEIEAFIYNMIFVKTKDAKKDPDGWTSYKNYRSENKTGTARQWLQTFANNNANHTSGSYSYP